MSKAYLLTMMVVLTVSNCLCQYAQKYCFIEKKYECRQEKLKTLQKLLQSCEDVEGEYQFTLLFQKKPKINTNMILQNKYTFLSLAAIHNKLHIAEFLINQGANIHHKSKDGTVLEIALKQESIPIIKLLVSCGAYPSIYVPTWEETPKEPGMYYSTLKHYPDNYDKLCGEIKKQFQIYSVCRLLEDWQHKSYYAVLEANKEYDKRTKDYKKFVEPEIAQHLQDISDLAIICLEFLMMPGMTLLKKADLTIKENYFASA